MGDHAAPEPGKPDPQALAVVNNADQLAAWAQKHLGLRADRYLGMGSRLVIEAGAPVAFHLEVLLTVEDMATLKELLP